MHDDPTIRMTPEPTPEPQQVAALFNAGLRPEPEANAPAGDDPQELQRHLPQYRVRELIGRGGMGNVMKVDDPKLARTVALKVMKLGPGASEEERGRFVREATVLAKLAHPNIVPIYDLGADDSGSPFYTMKLVKGRTLQAILKDIRDGVADAAKQHSLGRLLGVFRKVCDAMSFAHSRGVIHRDLKPENIMVGEFGEVLVMDWGLAKFLNGEEGMLSGGAFGKSIVERIRGNIGPSTMGGTLDGSLVGTPQYMSPEQAEGKATELDERSDIFSLGAILYAILTLHPPVEGKSVDEVLRKISSGQFEPPSGFGAKTGSEGATSAKGDVLDARVFRPLPHCPGGRVPAGLSAVTMRALSVHRARRYQSVHEFAAEVEAWQNGFATRAENAGFGRQVVLLVKRHKAAFATAAAAWLIITALAVWFVININHERKVAVSERKRAEDERDHAAEAERRRAAEERRRMSDRKHFAPALAEAARLLIARRDFASARVSVDQAVEYDPSLVSALGLKAALLAEKEDYTGAAAVLANSAGDDATLARLHDLCRGADAGHRPDSKAMGEVFSALGLPSLAESYFSRAGAKIEAALAKIEAAWPKAAAACSLLPSGRLRVVLSNRSDVPDLSPLGGLPIEVLLLSQTKVKDLKPLKGIRLREITLDGTGISDLSPLRGMPLTYVSVSDCYSVRDLAPLSDAPLNELKLNHTAVSDLAPLRKTPLKILRVSDCRLKTLDGLRGMGLTTLEAPRTDISNLAALDGMPLASLDISENRIDDIAPLAGMQLTHLRMNDTRVRDISVLRGMPLKNLDISRTNVADVSPLADLAISEALTFYPEKIETGMDLLRANPRIKGFRVRGPQTMGPEEFWKRYDAHYF